MLIRLNSSKQHQAPADANPLKNFPTIIKSIESEQLNDFNTDVVVNTQSIQNVEVNQNQDFINIFNLLEFDGDNILKEKISFQNLVINDNYY